MPSTPGQILQKIRQGILQGPPAPIIGGLVLLQLLAMHVPLLLFGILLAGVLAAFLMLVRLPREAALILALSGIIYAALSYLITSDVKGILAPLIFLGTPALLGAILRLSGSLSLAILCGFAGGWIGAQILGWMPLNLEAAWVAALESFRQTATEAGRAEPFAGLTAEWLSQVGPEIVMASLALMSTLLLLLARKWESALQEAPFFRLEFLATRYGRVADIAFFAVIIAGWVFPNPLMLGLSLTLIAAFLFPGIATVHRLGDRVSRPLFILIPFYFLLMMYPLMLLLTATLGAAADLIGWGRRSAGTPDSS